MVTPVIAALIETIECFLRWLFDPAVVKTMSRLVTCSEEAKLCISCLHHERERVCRGAGG